MIRFIILIITLFYVSHGNAQVKLSKEFKSDIIEACLICKEEPEAFYSYKKDGFHLSHLQYTKNSIDSSFVEVTNLLNRVQNLEKEKAYVLYYLNGLILKRKGLRKASSDNFNKALSLINEDKKVASLNNVYIHLSKNYLHQKKYDTVITILENWKERYKKEQDYLNASMNFHNLGISYLHLENYKKAEENLLKSHELNRISKDTLDLAYSSIDLANLYYEQYKDSLAIHYFKKGLDYAKKSKELTILKNAYKNLAVVEKNRENYKKAMFYNEEYDKIKDSIWNRDKVWELAQKDKAITTAINKEKLNLEREKTKRILIFTSILLLLLMVVSYTGYKINKQRQLITKQNKDLEELHRLKDDLFAILGHDLRAPMHHILNINKQLLSKAKKQSDSVLTNLISKSSLASNKMNLILNNILHWILLKNKQNYLEKQTINTLKVVNLVLFDFEVLLKDKDIKTTIAVDDNLLMLTDINALKVVLRNVLDNAIKFTPQSGSIKIKAYKELQNTVLEIKDSGIGMEVDKENDFKTSKDTEGRKSTGLGLRLCNSFIKRNNGIFKIKSKIGEGTTIFIKLPNDKL
ncbi:ATP-binding protein [Pontimicrobium sp. MEBiC01747]